MNERERIQYWKEYAKIQGRLERRFLPVINKVLANQISSFTQRYLSQGGNHVSTDLQRVNGAEMALAILTLHVYSAIVYGTIITRAMKKTKAGNMGYNEEWTRKVLEYFKDHNLRMVSNITENTRKRILEFVSHGVDKGYGAEKIARMLKQDGFTKFRALRIVRTETVRATNYANFLAADELGFEVNKQWIATHDSRVRDSHKYLDGEVLQMDGTFENGCKFPGDPDAAAAETINCRCSLGFVPVRDRDGQLVEKPVNEPIYLPPERQSIGKLMMDIVRGAVIGFVATDLTGLTDVIKTFVKEIFKGIGLLGLISNLFEDN